MAIDTRFVLPASGTLLDAAARIEANHSRSVIVLNGEVVEGVISEGDILRALLKGVDIRAPLKDFIHLNFKYLQERDLARALELARRFGITLIPVVDAAMRLVDVVVLADILDAVELRDGSA